MRYIDKDKKQLIIDTPVHKSTTKTITKAGKTKENIKYVAHIPTDILIFLLDAIKPFDAAAESDAEYVNAMLSGKDKIYLSFYNHPGKDPIELTATTDKYDKADSVFVSIRQHKTSNSYVFTVSKKVFKALKNDDNSNYCFRFILPLNDKDYYFKNSVIDVMLV